MQGGLARSVRVFTHPLAASSSLWTAVRLSQTHRAVVKRPSRRRYAALNKGGRVGQAKELLSTMKAKSKEEAKTFFDGLHPRDKLDVVRLIEDKRRKRRADHGGSKLPKYFSVIFEKNYFFKEEDITEESTLGRGPGGQATNRRMQTAIVRHRPSDIIVKFSRFPSLWLNRRAARELLNLRLEEKLLGPTSRLGKARLVKQKRQQRRQRTVAYLTKKGTRLQARAAHDCHWVDFLTGARPLPEVAVQQMGLPITVPHTQPLTIALLFGAECNSWWPKLKAAVENAPAGDGSGDVSQNNITTPVASASAAAAVPMMLRYLFPAVYANSSEAEREQFNACKANAAARTNVARAFVCFCELFGLRLRDVPSAVNPTSSRCVLQKDGLNWVEYRTRMHQRGQLTAVARMCWPHVYLSLRELEMLAEARAIVVFLKKEVKGVAVGEEDSAAWAQEALRCLAQAVRDSTSAVAPGAPSADAAVKVESVEAPSVTHATTT